MSHSFNQTGDLDTLFQAARQIESALLKERAELQQLRKDFKNAEARHAHEIAQLQQALQQRLAQEESVKSQLASSQNQAQSLIMHARKLETLIAQLKTERAEITQRIDLELKVAQSAAAHARKQAHQAEQIAQEATSKCSRAQAELERAQADALEHDHRYRAALYHQQSQEKQLHDTMNALKDQLKQARAELARYKGSWQDAQHRSKRQQEYELKVIELEQNQRGLVERLQTEKQRREQVEKQLKSRDAERDMLAMTAKMNEDRVAKAETRLSQMAEELTRLRSMRTTTMAMAHAERAAPPARASRDAGLDGFEFDGLDQIAVTGYPVPIASS